MKIFFRQDLPDNQDIIFLPFLKKDKKALFLFEESICPQTQPDSPVNRLISLSKESVIWSIKLPNKLKKPNKTKS